MPSPHIVVLGVLSGRSLTTASLLLSIHTHIESDLNILWQPHEKPQILRLDPSQATDWSRCDLKLGSQARGVLAEARQEMERARNTASVRVDPKGLSHSHLVGGLRPASGVSLLIDLGSWSIWSVCVRES